MAERNPDCQPPSSKGSRPRCRKLHCRSWHDRCERDLLMDVGFIGLGNMGTAIATNLIAAGHRVRVWNRSRGQVDAMVARGAEAAGSARDAIRGSVVISMLPDDEAVRQVVVGGRLLDDAPEGLVHVNMATVSVAAARELVALHEAQRVKYVAAPVFGRPDIAAAARLNIVAAGDRAAIAQVQPLFDAIGQKTWDFGRDPVRANVVKLAGNFLIACAIEAMAEGVAMAKGYGISASELLTMLTSTLFASPAYQTYAPLIAERRYDPAAFKVTLGLKDVRLALAAGEAANVPLPFAGVVRDSLIDAVAHGDAERDWTAPAEVALRRSGRSLLEQPTRDGSVRSV
jgi:3-hydroxyisobutyrate dehydrogenase-like beta-hydroxyacid dehydrogenase